MDGRAGQSGAATFAGAIPVLGAVASSWLRLRSVEDASLDEAVGLLTHDAVLLDPVLSWCRVRAGDTAERLTTPSRAVIILGLPAVKSAVLGVSAVVTLNALRPPTSLIDTDGFWTHALAVGSLCENLSADLTGVDADEAMLAGLLHDCGRLILACEHPEGFARALDQAEHRARSMDACLRDAAGVDHHTAGKRLIEAWGLSAGVRDAVWHHGQSVEAVPASSPRRLVALVTLAKAWARTNHIGWSGEFTEPGELVPLCHAAGVDPRALDGAVTPVMEAVRDRARAIGLGRGSGVDPLAWSAAKASQRSAELAGRLRELNKESERSRMILGAIEAFQSHVNLGHDPAEVVGSIGRSACELLGVGRVAVVWQTDDAAPWNLSLVGGTGVAEQSRHVDRPPDGAQIHRPADLSVAHASQVLMACELGWLARLLEHLREAGTPALVGAGATGQQSGASCLVLAPVPRLPTDPSSISPVTGLWAWALEAAARARTARTLGEDLSTTNRALAATRDELASKQSMVRLGQMAAGAAHELNNPLTVIRGRAQMIAEKAATPKQKEDAAAITEAARQVSDMVTSMHLLSCPPKIKANDCDPMLVLRDAIDRARSRLPLNAQKTRVRINSDGLSHSMRFDAELVAQVLCEPIANAMLAKPGGEVHISIESEAFTDRLKVRVIDRGPGLSAKALTHAFDPFFSEQPAGRRAGLGLARARSLVDLMGGTIEVANNPGDIGGAYAELVLPQAVARKRAA